MNTKITGAGLMHLRELSNLQQLGLSGTQVTDAGVAELQEVLPNSKKKEPAAPPAAGSGLLATCRRASLYIGGVWIRQRGRV